MASAPSHEIAGPVPTRHSLNCFGHQAQRHRRGGAPDGGDLRRAVTRPGPWRALIKIGLEHGSSFPGHLFCAF
jgi:hypothetical protein